MKTKIVASLLIAGLSSSAFAAITKPSSSTLTSAAELLKLPTENRRNALLGKGETYYNSFVSIAFNDSQSMNMRWKALMAAAETRGDKATADLMKAGNHSQWYMRNAALVALSEVNPAQGQKLAQKLLKDKALVVRSAAVEVLQKNPTPEVRDLLWDELNQKYNFKGAQSLWIRHQIVEVLAKSPKDHELKIFANLLSDDDVRVQIPAVSGLEKLTGTKLSDGPMKQSELIGLWKSYVKKEKIAL